MHEALPKTCQSELQSILPSPRMSDSNDLPRTNIVQDEKVHLTTEQRYELKYLLSDQQVKEIHHWARRNLSCDENCGSDSGDSYLVKTLYLDSPDLDLFFGTGVAGRSKHRLRTYERSNSVWLESKRKKGDLVRKRRAKIDNYPTLPFSPEQRLVRPEYETWFCERVIQRQLAPVVALSYRRLAFRELNSTNNTRLTIDLELHGQLTDNYSDWLEISPTTATRLEIQPILEFKFDGMMPFVFRQLLQTFSLQATSVSKYRTSLNTLMAERLSQRLLCDDPITRREVDATPPVPSQPIAEQPERAPERPKHA